MEKNPDVNTWPIKFIDLINKEIIKKKFIFFCNNKNRPSCKLIDWWIMIPIVKNNDDLKKAWVNKWKNPNKINLVEKVNKIKDSWFNVERATIFFISCSHKALEPL